MYYYQAVKSAQGLVQDAAGFLGSKRLTPASDRQYPKVLIERLSMPVVTSPSTTISGFTFREGEFEAIGFVH